MDTTKGIQVFVAVAPSEAVGWEFIDHRRSGDLGRIHALKQDGSPKCRNQIMTDTARTMGVDEFLSHDAGCKFCKRIIGA